MIAVTLVVLVFLYVFFRYTPVGLRCAPPPAIRNRRGSSASGSAG